jgi:hypothetical protein
MTSHLVYFTRYSQEDPIPASVKLLRRRPLVFFQVTRRAFLPGAFANECVI